MKVIGVSGAHGVGKSTVLAALKALNTPNVIVDDFSVPRSVQSNYNMSLAEIVSDPNRIPEYQERIIERKADIVSVWRGLHGERNVTLFTDRTPIDFYAYTRTWVEKQPPDFQFGLQVWFKHYTQKCVDSLAVYDRIIFIPAGKFPFVAESQRGSEDTQQLNHEFQMHFITNWVKNVHIVQSVSIEDRVQEFLSREFLYV